MYDYQTERPKIFTDEGQRKFLEVRDDVLGKIKANGAVRMDRIKLTGDSWVTLAILDRMIELGDIVLVNPDIMRNYSIYTKYPTALAD